jgi:hypothetical protein
LIAQYSIPLLSSGFACSADWWFRAWKRIGIFDIDVHYMATPVGTIYTPAAPLRSSRGLTEQQSPPWARRNAQAGSIEQRLGWVNPRLPPTIVVVDRMASLRSTSPTAYPMNEFSYRKPIKSRPKTVRSGEAFFVLSPSSVQNKSEEALIVSFVSDRELFGRAYREIQPDYFREMPRDSGVFIGPLVRTCDIVPHATRPGDIDLLVIPYERNTLILERVLAIEVKAVRATFARQGRSPNEFGFSQGLGLLELGFPYVAVAHLIISDVSPQQYWRDMSIARVINLNDEVEFVGMELTDQMPGNLTARTYGRLIRSCSTSDIGLISAYVWSDLLGSMHDEHHVIVLPRGRQATLNPRTSIRTLDAVAAYYDANAMGFLDNPRHGPPRNT